MSNAKASGELIKEVRRILSAFPTGKRATAQWLAGKINNDTPLVTDEDLVNAALLWNQGKGYVSYTHNEEMDQDEWILTERGRKQEGLA
ncbi:hypothetical protein [Verrucomicrobium spinosum]|uniref:hypothetical protein n=1 Tax=Verrucomicrobium spinosum TaxID=2736 RepID=UPI0001746697|nr:hypothetical protein [Verrucomicrobium spinosum]